MKRLALLLSGFWVLVIVSSAQTEIIRVPGDHPTIQAGIDAAANRDTVLVADGIYRGTGNRDLDFRGKAITVTSENGARSTIIDCEKNGRGFYFHRGETSSSVVSGFTITNGSVTIPPNHEGGGIYCDGASPRIIHNIIIGNEAMYGGGIWCLRSSPEIIDNTIVGNKATGYGGGGIYCAAASPVVLNTILWDNSPDQIYLKGGSVNIAYSDVEGGMSGIAGPGEVKWGEGNIDSDPLFVDRDDGDYRLRTESPCINTGNPKGSRDLDGTIADMGAGVPPAPIDLEILTCRDVEVEKNEPMGITDIFGPADERACVYMEFSNVPSNTGYQVHIVWYNPDGRIYNIFNIDVPEHPNSDRYYRYWAFIGIKGHKAADMPGEWTVMLRILTSVKREPVATDYRDINFFMKEKEAAPPLVNWPMFQRDAANTGYTDEEEIIPPLELRWEYKTDKLISGSPVVTDEVVYIGSLRSGLAGSGPNAKVYAIDIEMGEPNLKWINADVAHDVSGSPAVAHGLVYVTAHDGYVYALEAETGRLRWKSGVGGDVGSPPSSPVVWKDILCVGSAKGVYVFDAVTGKERWWNAKEVGEVRSSPAIAYDSVYVGASSGLHVFDLDGELRWKSVVDQVWSPPVVADGVVYVYAREKTLYAFDARSGRGLWKFADGLAAMGSPAVANGTVYAGYRESLYALDADSGTVRWEYPALAMYSTPAVVGTPHNDAGELVFFAAADNRVYALDTRTGALKWQSPEGLGKIVSPALAISDGCVYVAVEKYSLYAFSSAPPPTMADMFYDSGTPQKLDAPYLVSSREYVAQKVRLDSDHTMTRLGIVARGPNRIPQPLTVELTMDDNGVPGALIDDWKVPVTSSIGWYYVNTGDVKLLGGVDYWFIYALEPHFSGYDKVPYPAPFGSKRVALSVDAGDTWEFAEGPLPLRLFEGAQDGKEDVTPPAITALFPRGPILEWEPEITLSISASDESGIDGVIFRLNGIELPGVKLVDGVATVTTKLHKVDENHVEVEVTDKAGNRTSVKWSFDILPTGPPTGDHTCEIWFRYTDYELVPEQRADGLYLVSAKPTLIAGEYTQIFDRGEEVTGNIEASGTRQELKVIFDENGVPVRAVGSSYGSTARGSDSYGRTFEAVIRLKLNASLSPDMQLAGLTAEMSLLGQVKGQSADYINAEHYIVILEPDPKDPTRAIYHGVGTGVLTRMTGFTSVGIHAMKLTPGLNMVSLPLKPLEPYTARSFTRELGATVIIRYDEANQRFSGFTSKAPGDGFPIEAGKGYIINVLEPTEVELLGTIWGNVFLPEAAPPATHGSAWAIVVSGSVLDGETMSARDRTYIATVKNLRTGAVATEIVDADGYFAAAWADLSRKAVAEAGDRVEVTVIDGSGDIVSGPLVSEITPDEIRNAVVNVRLRLGDIIPAKPALLQNYPNPFNPETWIPYQLVEDVDVSIKVFDVAGQLVKTLDLGHKAAGAYTSRSKAAYWGGTNEFGEHVASGLYFYNIQAGEFAATRKLVISK